jgi:hypothetical protein
MDPCEGERSDRFGQALREVVGNVFLIVTGMRGTEVPRMSERIWAMSAKETAGSPVSE